MEVTIHIQNLKCHGCAHTIITQLSKLNGISKVSVDNTSQSISFNYNSEEEFNLANKKLSDLGYPIVGSENAISKKAKSFVSCAFGRLTK